MLVKFLLNGHERTKIFVLRCLWSLSFHPNNKFQMQCEPDLISELNAKVASVHPLIRKHAQGMKRLEYLLSDTISIARYIGTCINVTLR